MLWRNSMRTLKKTRACDIFGHRFHFDEFSTVHDTVHTNTLCMHFQQQQQQQHKLYYQIKVNLIYNIIY